MWIARVQVKGLTAMAMDMRGRTKKIKPSSNAMTKRLMRDHLDLYRKNLSGSRPSTAARPLPVGVRTGWLLSRAQAVQINQYAYRVFNDADYSGWIEDGTRFMAPRRPLQDATDQIEEMVPGEMNDVVTEVWEVD